jgi:hypothetical protein
MDDIGETGNGSGDGWSHSDEARRKMSQAKQGKKVRSRRSVTSESRRRMSEAQKRKWRDPEHRERVTKAIREGMENKKRPRSDETAV